jgi:hypothetical protein
LRIRRLELNYTCFDRLELKLVAAGFCRAVYGDRTYRACDPEGHIWTFGVTEKRMTPEEWDKASGLTTKKRLD